MNHKERELQLKPHSSSEQSLIKELFCNKKLSVVRNIEIIYWIYLSRQGRDKDQKYFSLKDI